MDINMPQMDGLTATYKIKKKYPQYLWYISDIEEIGSREVIDSSTRFGYFILAINNSDVDAKDTIFELLNIG